MRARTSCSCQFRGCARLVSGRSVRRLDFSECSRHWGTLRAVKSNTIGRAVGSTTSRPLRSRFFRKARFCCVLPAWWCDREVYAGLKLRPSQAGPAPLGCDVLRGAAIMPMHGAPPGSRPAVGQRTDDTPSPTAGAFLPVAMARARPVPKLCRVAVGRGPYSSVS